MLNMGIVVLLGLTNRIGSEATDLWIRNLSEPPPHSASDLQRQYEENGQHVVDFTNSIEKLREEIRDEALEMEDLWAVVGSLQEASQHNGFVLRCGDLSHYELPPKLRRLENRMSNMCYDFERKNTKITASKSVKLFSDDEIDDLEALIEREEAANAAHLRNVTRLRDALAQRQDVMREKIQKKRTLATFASRLPWALAGVGAAGLVMLGSRVFMRKQRR